MSVWIAITPRAVCQNRPADQATRRGSSSHTQRQIRSLVSCSRSRGHRRASWPCWARSCLLISAFYSQIPLDLYIKMRFLYNEMHKLIPAPFAMPTIRPPAHFLRLIPKIPLIYIFIKKKKKYNELHQIKYNEMHQFDAFNYTKNTRNLSNV